MGKITAEGKYLQCSAYNTLYFLNLPEVYAMFYHLLHEKIFCVWRGVKEYNVDHNKIIMLLDHCS